ncbi:putative retrotransposon gag domain-containing protein [Helianthus annuus]|nr:putative retrotransposon gag domain-containing protein [Helianthus annuus]
MDKLEKTLKEHAQSIKNSQTLQEDNRTAINQLNLNLQTMFDSLKQQLESFQLQNNNNNHIQMHHHDQRLSRIGRLDFPKFNGDDVDGWIYKCNHFFLFDKTPENMKIQFAVINLEGVALKWHQGYLSSSNRPIELIPWDEYVRSITTRFSEDLWEDAMEELKNLQQSGSLDEYCNSFDLLMTKVTLSEEYAASLFVGGLKPEIRCLVKVFRPNIERSHCYG